MPCYRWMAETFSMPLLSCIYTDCKRTRHTERSRLLSIHLLCVCVCLFVCDKNHTSCVEKIGHIHHSIGHIHNNKLLWSRVRTNGRKNFNLIRLISCNSIDPIAHSTYLPNDCNTLTMLLSHSLGLHFVCTCMNCVWQISVYMLPFQNVCTQMNCIWKPSTWANTYIENDVLSWTYT